MATPVDRSQLKFDIVSDESDLSVIDPLEQDEVDTLGVRKFLTSDVSIYRKNNLTSVWKVDYENQTVAFFTISMNSVGLPIIPMTRQISEMNGRYPAMLLGQMWVSKSVRGKQIAYWICKYVIGLARKINPKIACSCVVLQTDDDERKMKPYKKAKFVISKKSDGKIWMCISTT